MNHAPAEGSKLIYIDSTSFSEYSILCSAHFNFNLNVCNVVGWIASFQRSIAGKGREAITQEH
ncbi:MAG: Glucokinase [Candidatus Tokpelaia sp. JSC085]|nr:MAG: Glucokinase [Candidatus Tokpelaia sp. JSC085]